MRGVFEFAPEGVRGCERIRAVRDRLLTDGLRPAATGTLTFVVLATMLVQTLCSMGLLAIAFMAPLVAADLGVPPSVLGLQVGFIYLWSMLCSPLAGVKVTRYGAARTSQFALVACAAGCLACATGSLAGLVVGSAVAGAAYSLTNPAASHILGLRAPARTRNIIFAIKQSGVPIGWAAAGIALPALAMSVGWQAGLAIVAVAMLVLAAIMQPTRTTWREEMDQAGPTMRLRDYFRLGFDGDRRLATLGITGLLYSAVQIAVLAYLVTALVEDSGWSPIAAGTAVAVMQVCGAVGRLGLAAIADRVAGGPITLVVTGMCTGLAAVATGAGLVFEPGPATVYAVIGVLGFFSMGWNGMMLAEVARLAPAGKVGAMTSRVMFYYYSGAVVGPWLFSLGYEFTLSYGLTYALSAAPALAGGLAIMLAHRKRPTE